MVWRFQSGDQYNLDDLLGFKRFFEDDYKRAEKELERMERWRKYGLPNWRSNYIRAQMGVQEAAKNIEVVLRAIEETKARNEVS